MQSPSATSIRARTGLAAAGLTAAFFTLAALPSPAAAVGTPGLLQAIGQQAALQSASEAEAQHVNWHRRRSRRGPRVGIYLGAPLVAPYYHYGPRRPYSPRRYAGRCHHWSNQCAANWGYGNSNYYGCMRYHGC